LNDEILRRSILGLCTFCDNKSLYQIKYDMDTHDESDDSENIIWIAFCTDCFDKRNQLGNEIHNHLEEIELWSVKKQ